MWFLYGPTGGMIYPTLPAPQTITGHSIVSDQPTPHVDTTVEDLENYDRAMGIV